MQFSRGPTFQVLKASQWHQLPSQTQVRYASLRDIKDRIVSVQNIGKITKSMQMVASSKLKNAQNKLPAASAFGETSFRLHKDVVPEDFESPKKLAVVITSDRGLCGSINSGIAKKVRLEMKENPGDWELICVGSKGAGTFSRTHAPNMRASADELGRKPMTFLEIGQVADFVTSDDPDDNLHYEEIRMYHNEFVTVLQSDVTVTKMMSKAQMLENSADALAEFEVDDDSELEDYHKFSVAGALWNATIQNQASELGARMTSMDNATRNAGDIALRLTRAYNRGRQAAITTELIEIISGASAIEG